LRKNCDLQAYYVLIHFTSTQGRNEGDTIPRAPIYYARAESLRGGPKNPNNITSIFFNTVNFFRKSSGSNMGGQTCFLSRAPSNFVTPLRQQGHHVLRYEETV